MTPTELVRVWVEKFNNADVEGLAALYAPDAVNDQVVFTRPMEGRGAIRQMFEIEFGRAEMVCIEEYLYECDDTAILRWRDPNGLRGCGFFEIRDNQIVRQTGYFDQLSFFRKQGLPVPDDFLGGS